MWDTPSCRAKVRVLQWVARGGGVCSVVSINCFSRAGLSLRRERWRTGSCRRASTPPWAKALRADKTVGRETPTWRAIARLGVPCAASRITRQRRATRCVVLPARARVSKVVLTSLLMLITVLGLNIHPAYNMGSIWSIIKCYATLELHDYGFRLLWQGRVLFGKTPAELSDLLRRLYQ